MYNQKTYIIGIVFTALVASTFFQVNGKSDGGPPYNTKAPGEKSCSGIEGANACHSGGVADNAGPGISAILFDNGNNAYIPGQTYTIKPRISRNSCSKFGFQIVSLRNSNGKFTGTITLDDTSQTRMQQPTWGSYQDRNYVMHRLAGTAPVATDTGEWTYRWKAPSTNQGPITFYACFMAANGNATNDKDDQTYYTKLTITPTSVDIKTLDEEENGMKLFPNPASGKCWLQTSQHAGTVELSIVDLSGKRVMQEQILLSGNSSFDVTCLPAGMYIVWVKANNKVYTQKLMKE